MPFRSSLFLLVLSVSLAACDSGGEEPAQPEQGLSSDKLDLGGGKAGVLSGEIDRKFAGTLLPAVNIVDPDGRELNLGAAQGQPVLINLWATWCAPCIVEMPMLDNLDDEMGDELRVLTVSQDLQGAEKVVPFFESRSFRNLEPWLDTKNELGFGFGGGSLPMTVLYDASGQEVFRVAGGYEWDSEEAIAQIREALAE